MNGNSTNNLIKSIIWSIFAIGVGITFSGLIVHAFSNKEETETAVTAQEIQETSDNHESKLLAYITKLKDWAGKTKNLAGDTLTNIDFNKILYPPQASYHLKDKNALPDVGASAYVVADADTGEIIVEKNPDEVHPIASVTKLMTALVSLEDIDQSELLRVSNHAVGTLGTTGQLVAGEKIKVSDILYPLLLVSSNDAAEVLAENEGHEKFMGEMNEMAKTIGMTHTNYEDPSGLSANNYSTAKDLFALTHYLFNNHKTVFNITALDKFSLGKRTWTNANRFSQRDDYLGGKTGYTDKAHRTGVAIFSVPFEGYDNRNIAVILLKTDNRTEDINNILDYLKQNVYFSYEEEDDSSDNAKVTLGFVGDIMLDRGVKTSVYKNLGGDYDKVFSEAKSLKDNDIMFANLEGPISDKGHNVGSKYSFRFEPEVTSAIKNAGFDIVSFANNHVGDWSDAAFQDTLGRLSEANILFTGAGQTYNDATKPTIIERSGIKIGYLGFSDVGPEWMAATDTKPGILLANDKNLPSIISEAKKSVDFLIVSMHWGEEYKPHTARQESLAKKMIDSGADLIVGSHPHVAQDVQTYKNGLIIYSLGNFVFDQSFSEDTMQGLYEKVTITKKGIESHEENIFKINDNYQPVINGELVSKPKFSKGSCPSGNSEDDYTLFDANNQNSVNDYIPEGLVEINKTIPTKEGRTVCLIDEAAEQLQKMHDDAKDAGLDIVVTSGFRSYQTQASLYGNPKDHSDDDDESIAKPGHSEHQLGTTVDLTTKTISNASATPIFGNTAEYKWMSENAYKYGFVMSYPEGKDTGYIFEPWHWRYLGISEAKDIHESSQTIQEYLEN